MGRVIRTGQPAAYPPARTALAVFLFSSFSACGQTPADALLSLYPLPDLTLPALSAAPLSSVVTSPIDKSTVFKTDTALTFKKRAAGSVSRNAGFYAGAGSSVDIDAAGVLLRIEGDVSKYLVSAADTSNLTLAAGSFEAVVPGAGAFLDAAGRVDMNVAGDLYVDARDSLAMIDITGGTVHIAAGGDITLNGNQVAVTERTPRYGTLGITAGGSLWVNNPDPFWGESSVQVSMGSDVRLKAAKDVYLTGDFTSPQSWVLCAMGARTFDVAGDSVYVLRKSGEALDTAGDAVWSYDSHMTVSAEKLIYIAGGIRNTESDIRINEAGKAAVVLRGDLMFSDYKEDALGSTRVNFGEKGLFIGSVIPNAESKRKDAAPAGSADLTFGRGSLWQVTDDSAVESLTLDHAVIDFGAAEYAAVKTGRLTSEDSVMMLTFDTRDLRRLDYLEAKESAEGSLSLFVHSSGVGDGTASGPVVIVPEGSAFTVSLLGGAKDAKGRTVIDIGDFLYTAKTENAGGRRYTYFEPVLKDEAGDAGQGGESEGGDKDEGSGNPNEGAGNPEEGSGTPGEGNGHPEEGSGTPEEGGDSGNGGSTGDADAPGAEGSGPEGGDGGVTDSGGASPAPEPAEPAPGAPHPAEDYELSPSAFAMVSLANPSLMTAYFLSGGGDLRERIGEIRDRRAYGVYGQVTGGEQHLKNRTGSSTRSRYAGARVGIDAAVTPEVFAGAGFKIADLSQKAEYQERSARASANAETLKVYSAWVHPKGWYADASASLLRYETTVKTAMLDGTGVKGHVTHFGAGASLEAGRKIALEKAHGLFIEPQIELTYLWLNARSFKATNGMQVRQKSAESLTGRAGLVFGQDAALSEKSKIQWSLKGGIKHEFLKPDAVTVNSVDFSEVSLGTRLYGGIGLEYRRGNAGAYLNAQRESGHNFREDWRMTLGVKLSF
jgi:outer membrane autotransporter protein